MEKEKSRTGRRRIMYAYDGTLDPWVPATREFLDTLMPETLSKRAASAMLIAAGLGNEKIVELTGMCIRSVRALRKHMEENEATSSLFVIKPGSGRKKKTAGIEEEIFAELDKGEFQTHKDVIRMLKEKFGIETSINLVSRLMKRWRQSRGMA